VAQQTNGRTGARSESGSPRVRGLRELYEHAANGIFQCASDGTLLTANPAMARMLGYDDASRLSGMRLVDVIASEQAASIVAESAGRSDRLESFELPVRCKDGPLVDTILNARTVYGRRGRVLYREGILTNISDLKRQEARLLHLATHDPLTGLHNRREFNEILERHFAHARRYATQGALLWMDLDGFKEINDGLGHKAGDELLASLAHRMRATVRESDVLARLGGDEFAVLYPNVDRDQAQIAASRLLEAIRKHQAVIEGRPLRTTASIGIVLFPEHGTAAGELLMKADMAMYRAKEEGRNRITVYSPDQEHPEHPESRIDWLRLIRDALETDGFVLYAQPILDLRTAEIVRYEILLRLRDQSGKIIPPGAFLDVAEQFGLSSEIDRWVLGRTMSVLADANLSGRISFAVNLSPKSLSDRALLEMISDAPGLSVIGPVRLVMEITETAAIYNIHVAKDFLRAVRAEGCEVALDDFGMGFSSFYQLKNLDIDYLKIDGSFIRNLTHDPVDKHLVLAMVHLAKSLGKRTIAEFVEDASTLALLREIGVDCAQGFHIGRPQPLAEVLDRLNDGVGALR